MAQQPAKSPKRAVEIIGRKYVDGPIPDNPATGRVYSELADIINRLFTEIPVPVQFQKQDPYSDYQDMAETVAREQKLRVYNQHTDHPYFSHMDQLAFRAVHDWHGHLEADADFTPEGEFLKWEHMCRHLRTEKQKRVMFAEVVGQVGAVHYLPDGFEDPAYEQKAFIAPKTWIRDMTDAVYY